MATRAGVLLKRQEIPSYSTKYEAMVLSMVRKEEKRHTAGPQRRGNLGNEQPYPEALQNIQSVFGTGGVDT